MLRSQRAPLTTGRKVIVGRVIVFLAIIGAWAAGSAGGFISPYVLPGPLRVLEAARELFASSELWIALLNTLRSWIVGLAIAFIGGNIIGLALGASRFASVLTRPVIDLLRSIPAVTLVPLAILMYGTSLNMKLVIIVYGAVWEVIVQAIYAAKQVDPVASDTMRVYDVRGWRRVRSLLLPSAAPFIATGFRVAAVISFLLSIGAEIVGGAPGLGNSLKLEHESGNLAQMWVYIAVASTFGILLNLLLSRIDKRVLRGHPGFREVPA